MKSWKERTTAEKGFLVGDAFSAGLLVFAYMTVNAGALALSALDWAISTAAKAEYAKKKKK